LKLLKITLDTQNILIAINNYQHLVILKKPLGAITNYKKFTNLKKEKLPAVAVESMGSHLKFLPRTNLKFE
jgi:hypothetical protein